MAWIFRTMLVRSRWTILGWGIGLGVLAGYLLAFFDTIAEQQAALEEMMAAYPPELLAFFGDMRAISTPEGYLTIEFFSFMPIILGILAVIRGAGLLISDEEKGTLDMLLSQPLLRTRLLIGRFLGLITILILILLIVWLGFVIALRWSTIQVTPGQLALPFISLWVILIFYGSLALLLSLVLPSKDTAAMFAGLLLVSDFFIQSLALIDDRLLNVAKLFPLKYYQSGAAINGLNWEYLVGLAGATLILFLGAWWLFQRRDIRTGGQGGWQLKSLIKRTKNSLG